MDGDFEDIDMNNLAERFPEYDNMGLDQLNAAFSELSTGPTCKPNG